MMEMFAFIQMCSKRNYEIITKLLNVEITIRCSLIKLLKITENIHKFLCFFFKFKELFSNYFFKDRERMRVSERERKANRHKNGHKRWTFIKKDHKMKAYA